MNAAASETRAVRPGEELNVQALTGFVAERVAGLGDVTAGEIAISQFPGGHSNLTYLLQIRGREYVLRRPPLGNRVKSAHDMGREVRICTSLRPHYAQAPNVVAHCDDAGVLGAPFYLMDRVRGTILRKRLPAGVALDEAALRRLSTAVVDGLAALHAVDFVAAGLGDFGKPEGYVARQVTGWAERYEKARTDDIPEVPQIARWLLDRVPVSPAPTVLHNDWKYDNLVLEPRDLSRIVGVLDWEMATVGDPLMDLGTTLSYWVDASDDDASKSFAFGPTHLPGSLRRAEVVARYAAQTGRDTSNIVFYYCFALFKTAVVAQQIYARYKQGLTRDERFAMMIVAVQMLSHRALAASRSGEL